MIVGCLVPWWRSRYHRLCRPLRSRNPQVPRAPVAARCCSRLRASSSSRKFVGPRAGLRTCAAGPPFTCIPTFRPSAAADTPPAAPAAFRDHMYPVVCVCLPACVAPAAPGSMRPIAPKTTLKYEFESRAVGARAIRCWFPSGPSLIWFCLLPSALARPLGRTRALRVPYRRDTCVEGPPSCSLHSLLSTAFNSSYLRAAGWPSTQRIALRCPVRFAKEVLKSDSNHMHS